MTTKRAAVSCGCVQLYDLGYYCTARTLNPILVPMYLSWGDRIRAMPGIRTPEDQWTGKSDGKIYRGETVIFSDNDGYGNAKKIVALIKKHELGELVSKGTVNPNTRSRITTYLWVYNGNKIKFPRKKKTTTAETK